MQLFNYPALRVFKLHGKVAEIPRAQNQTPKKGSKFEGIWLCSSYLYKNQFPWSPSIYTDAAIDHCVFVGVMVVQSLSTHL